LNKSKGLRNEDLCGGDRKTKVGLKVGGGDLGMEVVVVAKEVDFE